MKSILQNLECPACHQAWTALNDLERLAHLLFHMIEGKR